MRIGINCGHTVDGQPGSGARGYISEGVEVRNVGRRLIKLLRDRGVTIVDCTDDYAESTSANLAEICRLANKQPLDLFVSIHFNSGGGHGVEVFTAGAVKHAEAVNMCDALAGLGFRNRGVKDGSHLYVIRHTDAKAMLIEVCFVDTDDAELYKKIGADIIAQALCNAIIGESEELTMTQYEELKNEIQDMKPMIYNYIDENMPSWARPTIQKLKDKRILVGDEEGKLGLTMDTLKVLVVLDRKGVLE